MSKGVEHVLSPKLNLDLPMTEKGLLWMLFIILNCEMFENGPLSDFFMNFADVPLKADSESNESF